MGAIVINTSVRTVDSTVKDAFGVLYEIETSAGLPLPSVYAEPRLNITGGK